LTGSSTSSLRHHIRTKHPRDWAKVVEAEKTKAEQDAANKAEAKKLQEEMECLWVVCTPILQRKPPEVGLQPVLSPKVLLIQILCAISVISVKLQI